jgi:hypothetical protein
VHDSVRAVLQDPAFQRSIRSSFADRILLWLVDWFERVERLMRQLPSARAIGFAVVVLIVLFIVARFVLASRADDRYGDEMAQRRGGSLREDPWASADAFRAAGRFEDAAHALYRGVLAALSRDERIRLDPSRTSGDYARELRRRASSSLTPFRAFTRRFDAVVYGREGASAAAIADLARLSEPFRPRARAA